MINVKVSINNKTKIDITAHRFVDKGDYRLCLYRTSNNMVIEHIPSDGMKKLVYKLIDVAEINDL